MLYGLGLIVFIFTFIFSFNPSSAQWQYLGLGEYSSKLIKYDNGYLYVGTDNGIYCKLIESEDTLWTHLGPGGETIEALLVLSDDTLLTGINIAGYGDDTISIYRTTDRGVNWLPFQNGYGGSGPKMVHTFDKFTGQSDTILAAGSAAIGISNDGGMSWAPLIGDWEYYGLGMHFIKVDTNGSGYIWSGGESMIFAPVLQKYDWFNSLQIVVNQPYTGDNACHDIAIDPFDSDICYIGMEGRLIRTFDGINFEIIEGPFFAHYVYGVEIDPLGSSVIYASGGKSGGNSSLSIFKSDDSGITWTTINDGPVVNFGAMDILLIRNGAVNQLYLPTYVDGVYRYNDSIYSICGDINGSSTINLLDVTFLIAYLYKNGPSPNPIEIADVNSSGGINILDITYLISYLYKNGPEPDCPI